jgi:hypothetical protein
MRVPHRLHQVAYVANRRPKLNSIFAEATDSNKAGTLDAKVRHDRR